MSEEQNKQVKEFLRYNTSLLNEIKQDSPEISDVLSNVIDVLVKKYNLDLTSKFNIDDLVIYYLPQISSVSGRLGFVDKLSSDNETVTGVAAMQFMTPNYVYEEISTIGLRVELANSEVYQGFNIIRNWYIDKKSLKINDDIISEFYIDLVNSSGEVDFRIKEAYRQDVFWVIPLSVLKLIDEGKPNYLNITLVESNPRQEVYDKLKGKIFVDEKGRETVILKIEDSDFSPANSSIFGVGSVRDLPFNILLQLINGDRIGNVYIKGLWNPRKSIYDKLKGKTFVNDNKKQEFIIYEVLDDPEDASRSEIFSPTTGKIGKLEKVLAFAIVDSLSNGEKVKEYYIKELYKQHSSTPSTTQAQPSQQYTMEDMDNKAILNTLIGKTLVARNGVKYKFTVLKRNNPENKSFQLTNLETGALTEYKVSKYYLVKWMNGGKTGNSYIEEFYNN
jgi:hypothetical protein